MSDIFDINDCVSNVLRKEALALNVLAEQEYEHLGDIVDKIIHCQGRIVFIGVGKSGIISKKVASTFNSLGIKSLYLYASEMLHGDLGALDAALDIAFIISKSGNSQEVINVIPHLQKLEVDIIGITHNVHSYLYKFADSILLLPQVQEVDGEDIVPTTSTTVQVAMGDAIAVTVARMKGFEARDFARFHPAGSIGKQLTLKVIEAMQSSTDVKVDHDDAISRVLYVISSGRVGACAVMKDNEVIGIITDGDIRRILEKGYREDIIAQDMMSKDPKTIRQDQLGIEAFELMEKNKITQLIVLDENQFCGIIHLHDCLREGII